MLNCQSILPDLQSYHDFVTRYFYSFICVALSGALMTGPLLMATISESPEKGFMAGPMLIFGSWSLPWLQLSFESKRSGKGRWSHSRWPGLVFSYFFFHNQRKSFFKHRAILHFNWIFCWFFAYLGRLFWLCGFRKNSMNCLGMFCHFF